ncbi:MAG: AraC family transcriptional regulator [Verrucomicrobiota bacterium]
MPLSPTELIQSPLNPHWLIPNGWEQILGAQREYPLGKSVLHLWRVQWNQHIRHSGSDAVHVHPHHQILYYQRGDGRLLASGEEYDVSKGSIFFIPAGCQHCFLEGDEETALCLALDFTLVRDRSGLEQFDNEEAVLFSLLDPDRARPFLLSPLDQVRLDECIEAIVSESGRREMGFAPMVQAYLLQMILHCLRATQRAHGFEGFFRHTQWRHALIAERVQALIREQAARPEPGLTLSEAARACSVSRNQLNRILKRARGATFQQLLIRERLEHAGRLIRSGQANCTEAAFAAGFSDSNYFARAFRKVYGHSPSELAREHPLC